MKLFRVFFSANVLIAFCLLTSSSHLTSCTKEDIHDTLVIHDTTVITDTFCDVNAGMIAYYNFKDGSLLDGSGKNNHIVLNSDAILTADRFGNPNGAFLFDGTSSYMKVPNSPSLNPQNITIMAIVKAKGFYMGTCHASEIIGKGYPDNTLGYYNLRIVDPYGDCYGPPLTDQEFFAASFGDDIPQGRASGATSDSVAIQLERWYNVIYTYDGKESRLYVDGQLKGVEVKDITFTPNDHDVFIGRHEDPDFPYNFNGVIDELRLYDHALCQGDITRLNQMTK